MKYTLILSVVLVVSLCQVPASTPGTNQFPLDAALHAIGMAHHCYFTVEQLSEGGTSGSGLLQDKVDASQLNDSSLDVMKLLSSLAPEVSVTIDGTNKQIYHLRDASLTAGIADPLAQVLPSFTYNGLIYEMPWALHHGVPSIKPEHFIIDETDLSKIYGGNTVSFTASGKTIRSILTDYLPLTPSNAILWVATISRDPSAPSILIGMGMLSDPGLQTNRRGYESAALLAR